MDFLRKIRPFLYGITIIALGAFAWVNYINPRIHSVAEDGFGQGDYTLMTTGGERFTFDTLRHGPVAVFFGFSHCPEICPTTLSDFAVVQDEMGLSGDDLPIYFITVDPERDTLDVLKNYVEWVPGAQGVTGTRDEIDKAIKAFRAYAKRVPLEGGGYTMDHSVYVMLFDRYGRFFEPIGYHEDLNRIKDKIQRLLAI